MKNRFFSIVILCICSACLLSVLVFTLVIREGMAKDDVGVLAAADGVTRILVAGIDESAENTDVLMLLSASVKDGSLHVLQIPRDTYLKYENEEGKINRFYRSYVSKYGQKDGAERFLKMMQEVLLMRIDAYAVFEAEALSTLVDSMGGVELRVPYAIDYRDEAGERRTLEAGIKHLNGSEALAYVRHRSSYTEGDLGRLDAQMRFVAALVKKIPELKFPKQYLEICQKNLPNLLTNLSEKDIINIMMVYLKNRDELSFKIMRLPGEACRDESGVWYYVLNRNASEEMLSAYFGAEESFDARHRFTREDREPFMNIYLAPNTSFRVYSLEEAQSAEVLHK